MQYTNWFTITQLIIAVFLSQPVLAQQPTGMSLEIEGDTVFKDHMEIVINPISIELRAELSTISDDENSAIATHVKQLERLRADIRAIGSTISHSAKDIVVTRSSGFLQLQNRDTTTTTPFTVTLSSDMQISKVMNLIHKSGNITISEYSVIYDEVSTSDNEIATQLTDKIITQIDSYAKETGNSISPNGISELAVETVENGRETLDSLVAGEEIAEWSQSEDHIEIIKQTKYAVVELVAR